MASRIVPTAIEEEAEDSSAAKRRASSLRRSGRLSGSREAKPVEEETDEG